MDEELSKGRRVLFTAIVIACVFVVFMELYHLGYAIYTRTEEFSYAYRVVAVALGVMTIVYLKKSCRIICRL